MGRITIFTAEGCPHSRRTMSALERHCIPYTEISVTRHPMKRKDMLVLSSRMSAPQVFFNTRHIGGADETIALLEEWDTDKRRHESAYNRFIAEIDAYPDPLNPRFSVPNEDNPDALEVARMNEYPIILPGGARVNTVDITEKLKKVLPRSNNFLKVHKYRKSFTGRQAVRCFMQAFDLKEPGAIQLGGQLQENGILNCVEGENIVFQPSGTLFRLQCDTSPEVLNSYCIWQDEVDPDPIRLIKRLMAILRRVESSLFDDTGRIAYADAHRLASFAKFEEAMCELQNMNLEPLKNEQIKLAFGMNLYNLMIKYAFMKVGAGATDFGRAAFFNTVKFNLGGLIFSLQEWEHGILRANRKAPYTLSPQLGKKDERLALAMKDVDCRIHFGLNCGAKSCPPVSCFSEDNVEEEMRLVAIAFCEDDDNVQVDTDKHELRLSKIFYWYRADFAENNRKLPAAIVPYLRGRKRQAVENMIDRGVSIKVSFMDYDWSTNASSIMQFEPAQLKMRKKDMRRAIKKKVGDLLVA